MQVHLVFRACKCWRLWYLGLGGDVSSREPCQLSPETGNFCLQSGNSIVCGGQGTVIVVDCSIEHLINIVLKSMSSTPMRISQLNILVDIDCLKTWLALIRRSFWELSIAIKTMRIIKELMKIWLNEVCDRLDIINYHDINILAFHNDWDTNYMINIYSNSSQTTFQVLWQNMANIDNTIILIGDFNIRDSN